MGERYTAARPHNNSHGARITSAATGGVAVDVSLRLATAFSFASCDFCERAQLFDVHAPGVHYGACWFHVPLAEQLAAAISRPKGKGQ